MNKAKNQTSIVSVRQQANNRSQYWRAPRPWYRGRRGGSCGRPARPRPPCLHAPPNHRTLRVHSLKHERQSIKLVRRGGPGGYHRRPLVWGDAPRSVASPLPSVPSVDLIRETRGRGEGLSGKLGLGEMSRRRVGDEAAALGWLVVDSAGS
jgi:hypothetical protein